MLEQDDTADRDQRQAAEYLGVAPEIDAGVLPDRDTDGGNDGRDAADYEAGYEEVAWRNTSVTPTAVASMLMASAAARHACHTMGRKLGAGLLKDAMLRTLQAADLAGIQAFVVHAKDDVARAFYERFDVAPPPTDAFHLFVPLKDMRFLPGR